MVPHGAFRPRRFCVTMSLERTAIMERADVAPGASFHLAERSALVVTVGRGEDLR
jgi:hypothetical protein